MVYAWIAAFGGFLYGFDIATLSGAIIPLSLSLGLTPVQMGWATSSVILGGMMGSLLAGPMSEAWGRKPTMLLVSLCYGMGALGVWRYSPDLASFICFRSLTGVGIGLTTTVCPMYLGEIAPREKRGKWVSLYQMASVLGLLTAFLLPCLGWSPLGPTPDASPAWRDLFLAQIVPAVLFGIGVLLLPETSPPTGTTETSSMNPRVSIQHPLMIGIALSLFQQITGINAFMYYLVDIFNKIGLSQDYPTLQNISVGITNLLCTIFAVLFVDRMGRRSLLMMGSGMMGVCLVVIGWSQYYQIQGLWLLIFVLGYIGAFALSFGAVVWVVLSEIFPAKHKSKYIALATATQWVSNIAVSQSFPMMAKNQYLLDCFHGAFPFFVYASFSFMCTAFTWKLLPETR